MQKENTNLEDGLVDSLYENVPCGDLLASRRSN